MITGSFERVSSQIKQRLEELITKADDSSGWLNRNGYRIYQNAQTRRWKTKGASEGFRWDDLNPVYRRYKLKRFKSYPGGGRKTMIATSRLVTSVAGKSGDTRKLVTKRTLRVLTAVEYAKYVDERRTFTKFSDKFRRTIRTDYLEYLKTREK